MVKSMMFLGAFQNQGYNMFDSALNYQYRAFGVPGLGLKRGLGEDLVVAPYASVMALMVDGEEACKNIVRISKDGFEGKFGLYEAIDYSPSRLPSGQSEAVIRSFMAHHQGMSLLYRSVIFCLMNRCRKDFDSRSRNFRQLYYYCLGTHSTLAIPSYTINTHKRSCPRYQCCSLQELIPEMRSNYYSEYNQHLKCNCCQMEDIM